MAVLHYSSHRTEPDDPTGDLVAAGELLEKAYAWVEQARLEGDPELAAQRQQVVDAYLEEYDAMVDDPGSGRLGQLDEGFRALGVGSYAS